MGGSMWGVLADMSESVRQKDPTTPSTFSKKIFPVKIHQRYRMIRSSRKALLKQRIKSVRLDLDIASSYMDRKERKALESLYMDLHFQLWSLK